MINCLIRYLQVPATPEERVRQACLHWMIHSLGYPKEGIIIEKSLREMPHLTHLNLPFPDRRIDILVMSQGQPLLVIECKAAKITPQAFSQLLGYHHWLKTPIAALVGKDEAKTLIYKDGQPLFQNGLPTYASCLKFLTNDDPSPQKQNQAGKVD